MPVIRNTGTGKYYSWTEFSVTEISLNRANALRAASANVAHSDVTQAQFDHVVALTDEKKAGLYSGIAAQLPITIEGASGEYLLSLMQQLQNNVNREITMVNGNIIQVTNNQTVTLLDAINAN